MERILKYDVAPESYLLDRDEMMKTSTKSCPMHELEKKLPGTDHKIDTESGESTTVIIDVMGGIRKARTKDTFGEFVKNYVGCTLSSSTYAERVDFIFDSYTRTSIKDSERQRRQHASPIDVVTEGTKMPVKMETFWSSNSNKRQIEGLIQEIAMETAKEHYPDMHVIASNMIRDDDDDDIPCLQSFNGSVSVISQLHLAIEEADERIIPHAWHAVTEHGAKRVVVISSDTDVFVLQLYYWEKLNVDGNV
jgi:hypothetical protein